MDNFNVMDRMDIIRQRVKTLALLCICDIIVYMYDPTMHIDIQEINRRLATELCSIRRAAADRQHYKTEIRANYLRALKQRAENNTLPAKNINQQDTT